MDGVCIFCMGALGGSFFCYVWVVFGMGMGKLTYIHKGND